MIWLRNVFAATTVAGGAVGFYLGATNKNKSEDTITRFGDIYQSTAGGVILGMCWPLTIAAAVATLVTK